MRHRLPRRILPRSGPGAEHPPTPCDDELTRLIRSVPAGGRIDGHIYSINVESVAQALLEAQNVRHVDVRLSTNGELATSGNPLKTLYFDKLAHKVYCDHSSNEACIGTADNTISHTKLFVFSTATAPDGTVANHVVWFGSANQTISPAAPREGRPRPGRPRRQLRRPGREAIRSCSSSSCRSCGRMHTATSQSVAHT